MYFIKKYNIISLVLSTNRVMQLYLEDDIISKHLVLKIIFGNGYISSKQEDF